MRGPVLTPILDKGLVVGFPNQSKTDSWCYLQPTLEILHERS